jgi:hypothetical protein
MASQIPGVRPMTVVVQFSPSPAVGGGRNVFFRTRGYAHGPVVRMVSPSDVGKMIKPFVFIDLVDTQERIRQQGFGFRETEHSDHENRGSRSFSSLQVLMCLHRVLQGIPLIDLDANPACRHVAE